MCSACKRAKLEAKNESKAMKKELLEWEEIGI